MQTKSQAYSVLADRLGTDVKMAKEIFVQVSSAIGATLRQGQRAVVPGLGSFSVKDMPARTMKHPQTGQLIEVKARKSLRFRSSVDMLEGL